MQEQKYKSKLPNKQRTGACWFCVTHPSRGKCSEPWALTQSASSLEGLKMQFIEYLSLKFYGTIKMIKM